MILSRLLKIILEKNAIMVRGQPMNRAKGLFAVAADERH
jgi:hypothetical protein